ncbi:hypothetical protein [Pseudomonas sp. MS19]|uniref:hypothetical protein n=1 Tax=Pseudomonas sp. MS19 TaxID=2579939 RepID=UPI001562D839|nr:hypothetical protein [Pseudomonas sp. MS19]NRH29000.1 hypothetical protein [Pseudomonas sp. MS19]
MNNYLSSAAVFAYIALSAACSADSSDTFTFTADLPPDFRYVAAVYYVPAKGETCRVATKDNLAPVFNNHWRTEYEPDAKIAIHRTRNGCPLVVSKIKLEIKVAYGKDWGDISSDNASVLIRSELEDRFVERFDSAGVSTFYGQCQWRFRTVGLNRRIVKLLMCKDTDAKGKLERYQPSAAYTLDQLPGKTVKMQIKLAAEELPAIGDTWVKVPNGWKRCMGKSFEDQYAFCFGNHKDFSGFQMPGGQKCSIYPGCTE